MTFGDPLHGNISSFGNQAGANRNLVTSNSLMTDLEAFTAKLTGTDTEGLTLLEEDSLRLQFAQLKLKTEVILLNLSASDGEGPSQHRLKDRRQQMQRVFLELDSRTLTRPRALRATSPAGLLDL